MADIEVVSGRVMGPRCAYASTVEVAYYLKPAAQGGMRALIPDPSYWDPQTPFLYEAIAKMSDGQTISQRHGLRQIHLSTAGLRVNRRPFRVQAAVRNQLSDAAALRSAGIDTIICAVGPATESLWNEADALGFFVLGIVSDDADSLAVARQRRRHASCLGWIFRTADLIDPSALQTRVGQEPLLGLLAQRMPESVPPWVQFLAGPAELSGNGRPWLFLNESDATAPPDAFGEVRGEWPDVD